MQNNSLEAYFNFDPSDLEMNRSGKLSPRQLQHLTKSARGTRIASRIIAVILVALTILSIRDIIVHSTASGPVDIGLFTWALVAGVLAFFFIRRSFEKIYDYQVKKVQGPIHIRAERVSSGSSDQKLDYELHVQNEIFDVDGELTETLQSGDAYTIYYIADPHSHSPQEILSVERS
jgi:hypothetical protein